MRKTVVNRFRDFVDFNVIQYGHEDCRPNYSIGNYVRSNYLIHYIHKGRGIYIAGGKEYSLKAGDIFLIYPYDVTYYRADENEPWEYSWVEFNGTEAGKYLSSTAFTRENPVIYANTSVEKPILQLTSMAAENPYELYSALMAVLAAMSDGRPKTGSMADEYVKYALHYIHTYYYHSSISVEEISKYVGINRSYLCRIFRQKTGVSPKRYVTEYKMKMAASLLKETNLTIGQVASSSGYENQLYFSDSFRRFYGISPSEYRKEKKGN